MIIEQRNKLVPDATSAGWNLRRRPS